MNRPRGELQDMNGHASRKPSYLKPAVLAAFLLCLILWQASGAGLASADEHDVPDEDARIQSCLPDQPSYQPGQPVAINAAVRNDNVGVRGGDLYVEFEFWPGGTRTRTLRADSLYIEKGSSDTLTVRVTAGDRNLPAGATTHVVCVLKHDRKFRSDKFQDYTGSNSGRPVDNAKVTVTGPPGILHVDKRSDNSSNLVLSDSIRRGEVASRTKAVTLSNSVSNGTDIAWTASSSQPWIYVSPSSGTLSGGAQQSVTLGFDSSVVSGLGPGVRTATVTFRNSSNGAVTGSTSLQVQLTVSESPPGNLNVLAPAGGGLAATVRDGSYSVRRTILTLSNSVSGAEDIRWSVSDYPGWLSISPRRGTLRGGAERSVTIEFNAQSVSTMASGNYVTSVNFTNDTNGNTTGNNPVPVSLNIVNTVPQEVEDDEVVVDELEEEESTDERSGDLEASDCWRNGRRGRVSGTNADYCIEVRPNPGNPEASVVDVYISDIQGLWSHSTGSVSIVVPEKSWVDFARIKKYLTSDHTFFAESYNEYTPEDERVEIRQGAAVSALIAPVLDALVGLVPFGAVAQSMWSSGSVLYHILSADEYATAEGRKMRAGESYDNCFDTVTVPWLIPDVRRFRGIKVSVPIWGLADSDYLAVVGQVKTRRGVVFLPEDGAFVAHDLLNSGESPQCYYGPDTTRETGVAWHSDPMGMDYTESGRGGSVTVSIKTLESGIMAPPPLFSIAGPGVSQTRVALAAGLRQSGDQTTRTWGASFDVPVNDSPSQRVYTITAASSRIEGNRANTLVIAPAGRSADRLNTASWHSDPMEFSYRASEDGGAVVTVSIKTLESAMIASAPEFAIAGPGLSLTQTASAAGIGRVGEQRSRTWETSVIIPAALLENLATLFPGEIYVPYTVTATSDQIEGDRTSQLILVPAE